MRVGLALYNRDGVVAFPLNQYQTRSALEQALYSLPVQQSSDANIASGMDVVRQRLFTPAGGDRPDAPNAVIVITDADSYLDRNRISSSAESLRSESGARIYTAGIGLRGSSQLSSVASSGSAVFSADNIEDLADVKQSLVSQMPPRKGTA